MDGVAEQMIKLLIDRTTSKNVRKGLRIALEIIQTSGYNNVYDWDALSDEEKWDEVSGYLEL